MNPTNRPLGGDKEHDKQAQRERDPRAELGLKSPTQDAGKDDAHKTREETDLKRQEAEGRKATQFDGNPNPQGDTTSAFGPKDDTPNRLKKVDGPRDDQK